MNWLNRIFHRHKWEQVFSRGGTFTINGKSNGTAFLILERCQCGTERAYIDRGTGIIEVSVQYAKRVKEGNATLQVDNHY